jgi:Protein of unknown function (DUF2865)
VLNRCWKFVACRSVGIIFTALAILVYSTPPVSSQGVFETLLGVFKRPTRPALAPQMNASETFLIISTPQAENRLSGDPSGPYASYCVRLCDGSYFPLQRSSAASAAEQCRSFCPAAKTKIFSGSKINSAVAPDGSRYTDLATAFLYRARMVNNCSCNGKEASGVARLDVATDPTLRAGDIVAVNSGFAAYTGAKSAARQASDFTPVEHYSGLSPEARRKLAETKVLPAPPREAKAPALMQPAERSALRLELRAQIWR